MEEEKLSPEDQLRFENEMKKINLEINHGAEELFVSNDLPPELEKMFLDNIANFEAQHSRGELIAVYDFIGQPNFTPIEEVEDFEKEIERILQLLEAKQVTIDRPKHLAPIGYYRFLTNDFFQHQMTNYKVEGMIHGFLYDEFRHDGPQFIKAHVEEFLLRLLNLEKVFELEWLSETCRTQTEVMTKEEALDCIHRFRNQFGELVPVAFEEMEMTYNNGFMYLVFGIAWDGKRKGEQELQRQEGVGICQLEYEGKEWMVQGVQMPGFEFEK